MNNSNNHRSVTIMHNNNLPVNYPALILSIYMACNNNNKNNNNKSIYIAPNQSRLLSGALQNMAN